MYRCYLLLAGSLIHYLSNVSGFCLLYIALLTKTENMWSNLIPINFNQPNVLIPGGFTFVKGFECTFITFWVWLFFHSKHFLFYYSYNYYSKKFDFFFTIATTDPFICNCALNFLHCLPNINLVLLKFKVSLLESNHDFILLNPINWSRLAPIRIRKELLLRFSLVSLNSLYLFCFWYLFFSPNLLSILKKICQNRWNGVKKTKGLIMCGPWEQETTDYHILVFSPYQIRFILDLCGLEELPKTLLYLCVLWVNWVLISQNSCNFKVKDCSVLNQKPTSV